MEKRSNKRWTSEEDRILLKQVEAFPQNLHKCFLIVAERLDRSESAVSARWYTKVSKDPSKVCFFTASPKHVSKNRKNGLGDSCSKNIWKKFLDLIRNIGN